MPFVFVVSWTAAVAWAMWRWAPHGELFAGVALGASVGMISWIRDEPPEFIAKWRRGADGERNTARALRRMDARWFAVHDKTTGRGNVDHVAVGPAGVFLLESKNLSGTVEVDERGLTAVFGDAAIDSYTNAKLPRGMRASAAQLNELIAASTHLRPWVHAVVVIWGEFPQRRYERESVTYIAGDDLPAWLEGLPDRLSARDANLIRLALEGESVVRDAPPLTEPAT